MNDLWRRRRLLRLLGFTLVLLALIPLAPWVRGRVSQQAQWSQTKQYANELAGRVGAQVYERQTGCGSSDGNYSVEADLTATSAEDLGRQLDALRAVLRDDGWVFTEGSRNQATRTVGDFETFALIGKSADPLASQYYVGFDATHCALGFF